MSGTEERDAYQVELARGYLEQLADHPDRETLRRGRGLVVDPHAEAEGITVEILNKCIDDRDLLTDGEVLAAAAMAVKTILVESLRQMEAEGLTDLAETVAVVEDMPIDTCLNMACAAATSEEGGISALILHASDRILAEDDDSS